MFELSLFNRSKVAALVMNFLAEQGIYLQRNDFEKKLVTHPFYPSLLSVSDTLMDFEISNRIIKIEKDSLNSIPTPFIAHSKIENEFFIVKKIENNQVSIRKIGRRGSKIIPIQKFDEINNNVALFLNKRYQTKTSKNLRIKILNGITLSLPYFSLIILGSIFLFFIGRIIPILDNTLIFPFIGVILFLCLGLIVATSLKNFEISKTDFLINKLCTLDKTTSCSNVLTSRYSTIIKGVKVADIVFLYFSTFLLLLVLFPQSIAGSLFLLLETVLFFPIIIFISLYYQVKIIKSICRICMILLGILVILGLISISFIDFAFQGEVDFTNVIIAIIPGTFILFFVYPLYKNNQVLKFTQRDLQRFKINEQVFTALLDKENSIETVFDNVGILIGNSNSEKIITIVSNPFCQPCAIAHLELSKLLVNDNFGIRLIFSASFDDDEKRYEPVRLFLKIYKTFGSEVLEEKLTEWFKSPKKNYNLFSSSYLFSVTELQEMDRDIDAMNIWCKQNNIGLTPTLFLNGKKIPNSYYVHELKYVM